MEYNKLIANASFYCYTVRKNVVFSSATV